MTKPRYELDGYSLVVVDMINAYLEVGEAQFSRECTSIIPKVRSAIQFFRENGGLVAFSNTQLSSDLDPMARKWGLHARRGSRSSQTIDELSPLPNELICGKTAYNGFFRTKLASSLRRRNVRTVVVCGIHTHACVLMTAVGALDCGFDVIVLEDCMTTAYIENHNTRLRFFSSHIGKIMKLQDFEALAAREVERKHERMADTPGSTDIASSDLAQA
jgi:nicotinamidase-related amidase